MARDTDSAAATESLPEKIEVDTAGLIAEWGDERPEPWEREDIIEVLHKIGAQDLMYSGDFIRVLDKDTEESIR